MGEAKAKGSNLGISQKHSTEIGNFIRGDSVQEAKEKLRGVIDEEVAVPYERFNSDLAHRSGDMAAGRYPVNAATEILKVVKSAEQNAIDQGLDEDRLDIVEFYATQGNRYHTPKRNRGQRQKACHVNIRLEER